ncbi:MAG: polysaccharide deacetylase family protein [Actinobacteria bacterium]|nr:MAG: polysaccharide deacetylase family protein [Actinomycetota bacterium]
MDRRSALRAAAAAAAGTAAGIAATGCGTDAPAPPAPTRAPSTVASDAPSASAAPSAAALPAEVVHGPADRPNVALTFHGQGDPGLVRQLLAELDRGGARVTVLAVGSWLVAQPAMARVILDGGHELGNHTQNHLDIAGMSPTQAFTEINTCAQRLKKLTGSIGTWFRPSATQFSTPVIREQATRVGYPTCLSYDLDSLDHKDPGAAVIVRTTLAGVRNGSIVSLHFGHPGTVAAMPALLDGLHQRGLRPVTMTELVG